MSKKFKFILTLSNNVVFDSEIKSKKFYAGSQRMIPKKVDLKGVFDTYEEALEYAKNYKVYKYVLINRNYDCFLDTRKVHRYYASVEHATEAAHEKLGIKTFTNNDFFIHPDGYVIKETEKGFYSVVRFDDIELEEDSPLYFETYEHAELFAGDSKNTYVVLDSSELKLFYKILPVEVLKIEVVEI